MNPNTEKYGHGSQWEPKPRIIMLVKTSSNLPDQTKTGSIENKDTMLRSVRQSADHWGVIIKQQVCDDIAEWQNLECVVVICRL
jgi:hypothetical protein